MNVLVVVPTYNERDNLPLLVRAVLAHDGYRMLIVDDGSPDGTGQVADALARDYQGRIEVMHRTGPRGLGRSYIDGLRHAIGDAGVDLICQMDADLSHDPSYLPALVAATAANDVVIGSRYLDGISVVNWPLHRIVLSTFANRYIRAVTRLSGERLHERLPLLAARGAGAAPARHDGVGRLRVPRRDAVRCASARLPHRRGPDHLRRAAPGAIEALEQRPDRVGHHAVAAEAARHAPLTPCDRSS